MSPVKLETNGHYLIVHFPDGVKHLDMSSYLKDWQSSDAKRLLNNIDNDLKNVYLEDGYAISWNGYRFSIDPEIFYKDAIKGYPKTKSVASIRLITALKRLLNK